MYIHIQIYTYIYVCIRTHIHICINIEISMNFINPMGVLYTWNAWAGEGGHLHLVESVRVPLDHAIGVEQGHGDSRILIHNLYIY
jgi:hypothetical protein